MEDPLQFVLGLVAIAVLVFLNAFFTAAEFALVRIRRTRVDELVSEGNRRAKRIQDGLESPNLFISASQLGITIASLALGWIGEATLQKPLEQAFSLLPIQDVKLASHAVALVTAFVFITFMHIVLGEIVPKNMAIQRTEWTSMKVITPLMVFYKVFHPFIWVLNHSADKFIRLFGLEKRDEVGRHYSTEEILMLVKASQEGGVLEKEEEELVSKVFEFSETVVEEIMVPRPDMIGVPITVNFDDLHRIACDVPHSRFPVYQDDLDHIIGVVHIRDVLKILREGNGRDFDVREIMLDVIYVPETKSVSDLLSSFKANHRHMAIVLDEFGCTSGMVTLEDVLEELVGEIEDEYDEEEEEPFQTLEDGAVLIDAGAPIEDVNVRFEMHIPDQDYNSLGGFVFGALGRPANVGDVVEFEGAKLQVQVIEGLRVKKVRFEPPPPREGEEDSDGPASDDLHDPDE